MANAVYPSFLDLLWNAGIDIGADTFKAAILGPSYSFDAAHEDYSDLTDILGEATLAGMTSTDGVLDADDVIVSGVTVEAMHSVVIYDSTINKLMLYFDGGIGFDVEPNGNVTIIWPSDTATAIFPLGGKP